MLPRHPQVSILVVVGQAGAYLLCSSSVGHYDRYTVHFKHKCAQLGYSRFAGSRRVRYRRIPVFVVARSPSIIVLRSWRHLRPDGFELSGPTISSSCASELRQTSPTSSIPTCELSRGGSVFSRLDLSLLKPWTFFLSELLATSCLAAPQLETLQIEIDQGG